jgi:hypothetical protein
VRQAGADRPPHADQVDLDHALEHLRVHAADEARRADAGVREQRVDPAERLDGAAHGGVERVAVGDVGLERDRAGAVGGDGLEVAEADERDAAPRAASRRAVSAPMPCAAPVMRTDWPEIGVMPARLTAAAAARAPPRRPPRAATAQQLLGPRA